MLKANIINESRIKKLELEGEKIKQKFLKQNSSGKKRSKTSFDNRISSPSTSPKRRENKFLGNYYNNNDKSNEK